DGASAAKGRNDVPRGAEQAGTATVIYCRRMPETRIACRGCGEPLNPNDEVREVYRELADAPVGDGEPTDPRWGYTHLGHEPAGTGYRITGRGRLAQLERKRLGERNSESG
ncbi:MAG TPA: hypothetical protein VFR46_11595, partial [Actinomycetes bacterium]|nr:hypothetical protein [Actinomycetes bacterium]